MGRTAVSISPVASSGSQSVTVSGVAFSFLWRNTTASYAVPSQNVYSLGSPYSCGTLALVTSNTPVLASIGLLNGESYQFFYGDDAPSGATPNSFGLISELIYPDGGWVRYTWKESDSYNEVITFAAQNSEGQPAEWGCRDEYKTPVIATRTVGEGSTTLQTQTFTYSTTFDADVDAWTSKTTKVSTTDNVTNKTFQVVYTYTPYTFPADPYVYGPVANQTALEQTVVDYDWGNTTTPLQTQTKTWANPVAMLSESVTLGSGSAALTKLTKYCYYSSDCTQGGVFPTEIDEYDWVQTSASLRRATYTYSTGSFGRPCKSVVSGSGGNTAETDVYFDNDSTLCGSYSSSSTQAVTGLIEGTHDETSYGGFSGRPRGNITSEVHVIAGSQGPTIQRTYDETGQMLSDQDPNGQTTKYSYGDAYSEGVSGGNTNAYLTKTTYPEVNNMMFSENSAYSLEDGQLTSSSDVNMHQSSYKYDDPLRRLTETDDPDGGSVTIAIPSLGAQPAPGHPLRPMGSSRRGLSVPE